jgi:uncharacterized MAPEG superfamily protein
MDIVLYVILVAIVSTIASIAIARNDARMRHVDQQKRDYADRRSDRQVHSYYIDEYGRIHER